MSESVPETIAAIVAAHRAGTVTPAQTVARSYQRIRDRGDPAIFITLRVEAEAIAEAEALAAKDPATLPLYGVPVGVKDNIDVAGSPTTAACPAFAYNATRDCQRRGAAACRWRDHHRQDQSRPVRDQVWSACARPMAFQKMRSAAISCRADRAPALPLPCPQALVPLTLGTDTAGSGRVPAMLNNIVGLKPSLGLIPTAGVVPACRTLDCVSIFTLTVDDAVAALDVMGGC